MQRNHSKRIVAVIASAGALVSLVACGDDDDGGASEEFAAFCDAELAVERATLGDDVEAIQAAFTALVDAAPDDDTRAVTERTIAEARAFMEAGMPPTDEFNAAYGELIGVMKEECGFEELEVEAAEYSFSGLDDELAGGPTIITFENNGSEFHEIIVVKRNEGVDTPAMELLMLDQEEAMTMVSDVGGAFAAPGTTGYTVVDLDAGDYIVACFLPVGATQDVWDAMMAGGPEPEGGPHAMEGMIDEFEVKA